MTADDMSECRAYEVFGLRENGQVYTVEVLGLEMEASAREFAQVYANQWQSTVRLYRVPFVNISSKSWSATDLELVDEMLPTR